MKVRGDATLTARFHHPAHEHNDFKVEHCINAKEQRLLKFLVPILNPEKPVTIITSSLMHS